MTKPAFGFRPARGKSRARLAVIAVALAFVVTLSAWTWAHSEGYVPGWSVSCDDRGWPSPPPSLDQLVNREGLDPYCARDVRGETWY